MLAAAGYGVLIPLLVSSGFNPWLWLGLTLTAGALLYLPVRRLLEPPVTRTRWFLIAVAVLISAYFLLGLVAAAIDLWPWWMWLGIGVLVAFVFVVPARSVFSSPSPWRRRIAIGGVSLLALLIVVSLIWSVVRDVWLDEGDLPVAPANAGGASEQAGNTALAGSGGDGEPPVPTPAPTAAPGGTPEGSLLLPAPNIEDVIVAAMPGIVEIRAEGGSGTGFIVHEDGLVITNKHVVGDTGQVGIRLATGGDYTGTVLVVHPDLDLAFIDIESDSVFTPLALGDSDASRVGAGVIAIGFPLGEDLGEDPTVTTGIISAKRQDLDFLQTNADLNPGNSGGPLLDEYGCVVGINTAGVGETGDGQVVTGINFAIPVNDLREALSGIENIPVCEGRQPEGMAVVPPVQPTPDPTPTPTAVPTPSPAPTPEPTPTLTPTHTPEPTETPTPQPTPMPTPVPTAIPTATPAPTPMPTATPRPTPIPRPTATPTPTLIPTPTQPPLLPLQGVPFVYGGNIHKYEIRCCGDWGWMTDAPSAGGRPYINITTQYVEDGDEQFDFYGRYRGQRLAMAHTYAHYEPLSVGNEGLYVHGEYIWQPQSGDCRYHVVEQAHPSLNAPDEYGYVISMGVCEADRPTYDIQREAILSSFKELQ